MPTCTSARESICLFGTFYVESPIDSGAVLYGSRMICPDEFVFGVLDYLFAVGVWVFGFWAWDEFVGLIFTDSYYTLINNRLK